MTPHQPTPPRRRIRWNGHRVIKPVELFSARVFRLRIALGLSVYDVAEFSGVDVGTIRWLEAGKPVDKRDLPAVAAALGVPLYNLICGEHDCVEKACVPTPALLRVAAGDYPDFDAKHRLYAAADAGIPDHGASGTVRATVSRFPPKLRGKLPRQSYGDDT